MTYRTYALEKAVKRSEIILSILKKRKRDAPDFLEYFKRTYVLDAVNRVYRAYRDNLPATKTGKPAQWFSKVLLRLLPATQYETAETIDTLFSGFVSTLRTSDQKRVGRLVQKIEKIRVRNVTEVERNWDKQVEAIDNVFNSPPAKARLKEMLGNRNFDILALYISSKRNPMDCSLLLAKSKTLLDPSDIPTLRLAKFTLKSIKKYDDNFLSKVKKNGGLSENDLNFVVDETEPQAGPKRVAKKSEITPQTAPEFFTREKPYQLLWKPIPKDAIDLVIQKPEKNPKTGKWSYYATFIDPRSGVKVTTYRQKDREENEASKFDTVRKFDKNGYDKLIEKNKKFLNSNNPDEQALALIVDLVHEGHFRIGNTKSEKDNVFGLHNLQVKHVTKEGNSLHFNYMGKKQKEDNVTIKCSPTILKIFKRLVKGKDPNDYIFTYRDGKKISEGAVNDFLRKKLGAPKGITIHKFRHIASTRTFKKLISNNLPRNWNKMSLEDKVKWYKAQLEGIRSEIRHDTVKTTLDSYIDPKVVREFNRENGFEDLPILSKNPLKGLQKSKKPTKKTEKVKKIIERNPGSIEKIKKIKKKIEKKPKKLIVRVKKPKRPDNDIEFSEDELNNLDAELDSMLGKHKKTARLDQSLIPTAILRVEAKHRAKEIRARDGFNKTVRLTPLREIKPKTPNQLVDEIDRNIEFVKTIQGNINKCIINIENILRGFDPGKHTKQALKKAIKQYIHKLAYYTTLLDKGSENITKLSVASAILAYSKLDWKKNDRIIVGLNREFFIGTVTAVRNGIIHVLLDNGKKEKFKKSSSSIIGPGKKQKRKMAIPKGDIFRWLPKGMDVPPPKVPKVPIKPQPVVKKRDLKKTLDRLTEKLRKEKSPLRRANLKQRLKDIKLKQGTRHAKEIEKSQKLQEKQKKIAEKEANRLRKQAEKDALQKQLAEKNQQKKLAALKKLKRRQEIEKKKSLKNQQKQQRNAAKQLKESAKREALKKQKEQDKAKIQKRKKTAEKILKQLKVSKEQKKLIVRITKPKQKKPKVLTPVDVANKIANKKPKVPKKTVVVPKGMKSILQAVRKILGNKLSKIPSILLDPSNAAFLSPNGRKQRNTVELRFEELEDQEPKLCRLTAYLDKDNYIEADFDAEKQRWVIENDQDFGLAEIPKKNVGGWVTDARFAYALEALIKEAKVRSGYIDETEDFLDNLKKTLLKFKPSLTEDKKSLIVDLPIDKSSPISPKPLDKAKQLAMPNSTLMSDDELKKFATDNKLGIRKINNLSGQNLISAIRRGVAEKNATEKWRELQEERKNKKILNIQGSNLINTLRSDGWKLLGPDVSIKRPHDNKRTVYMQKGKSQIALIETGALVKQTVITPISVAKAEALDPFVNPIYEQIRAIVG